MKDSKNTPTYPVEEEKNIEVGPPAETAAGVTAVISSFKSGIGQMKLNRCTKTYLKLNQTDGVDCPSCAWPDPPAKERSRIAEYCENGARAVAEEATVEKADLDFWARHSIDDLMQWPEWKLGKAGRITHPMVLKVGSNHYESIEWKDAFQLIAEHLNKLSDSNEAVFYTSGRTSNETAFLYQLFARMYGTNNLPDCSNMCHESTGVALSETIGIGKGTVTLEDFYSTDLILVVGQNPGTNHPRMLSALQKGKRNGAKIISINPLKEAGLKSFKNPQEARGWIGGATQLTDLFLPVRINGDLALLKAIMCLLLKEEEKTPGKIFDHDFIKKHTDGYEALIEDLEKQDIDALVADSSVDRALIEQAVKFIIESKKMIICWAMGITQHENAVDNIKAIVNLLLLKGSIGIKGGGACPVRGHSNVQGDRTVGIWEVLKPAFKERLEFNFNFTAPEKKGYNAVAAIKAMHEKKAKVFFSMGGNLLLAGPDTEYTAQAMRNCDLTVMVSTKPNRNHLVTGKTALILPCRGRTEKDEQASGLQFVSVENSMGIVHQSRGTLKPASPHLLSETDIVVRMATATLGNRSSIDWQPFVENYDLIRDVIEQNIPGFENYNQRVRKAGGFYLPNGPREKRFTNDIGKARFSVLEVPENPLQSGQYLMTTIRSHDQFNTTIYDLNDRYRGIKNGRRVIFMNKTDMQNASLVDGEMVDIYSHYKGQERMVPSFRVVEYDIPKSCVATYFPETNPLVPVDFYAKRSHTPASKSVVVELRKRTKD